MELRPGQLTHCHFRSAFPYVRPSSDGEKVINYGTQPRRLPTQCNFFNFSSLGNMARNSIHQSRFSELF
jgi:hypothetical protein